MIDRRETPADSAQAHERDHDDEPGAPIKGAALGERRRGSREAHSRDCDRRCRRPRHEHARSRGRRAPKPGHEFGDRRIGIDLELLADESLVRAGMLDGAGPVAGVDERLEE